MSSVLRRIVATVLFVAVWPSGVVDAASCWRPPVDAPVADPYREPACRWCSGNRGIEFATSSGANVRAVSAGVVSWAGAVAGTVYVVVRLADGRRLTYGNLKATALGAGDRVVRGRLLGQAAGRFHLGLRDGDRYVDPSPFLGRIVYPVRLVPLHGRGPTPRPRLVCAK